MTTRYVAICTGALLGAIALGSASAQALTMQECSAKYKAAQTAGTLKGMKWNDFRKAECGTDASATPVARRLPRPSQQVAGSTDQYNANKTNNGNGGLVWRSAHLIQRGKC
jgi:hypothetical protein